MFFFCTRTFFRQAAVKQGETRDRSLRAGRTTGVGQDIALQRRGGRGRQRRWGVGKGSQRTLPALRLRASAPTGACTRLRPPCRCAAGLARARPCAMRWRKASVSSPHLPATSRASTIRRHRRARWNSG